MRRWKNNLCKEPAGTKKLQQHELVTQISRVKLFGDLSKWKLEHNPISPRAPACVIEVRPNRLSSYAALQIARRFSVRSLIGSAPTRIGELGTPPPANYRSCFSRKTGSRSV